MIGVDEVGRGCLAGPLLVVAAKQIGPLPKGLKDSKLLSRRQRQSIYQLLTANCQFGEGWVKTSEIDKHGLAKALRLGVTRSLRSLGAKVEEQIVIDGKMNYAPEKFIKAKCVVDADDLVPIVSAASIYAKVKRDAFMIELAKRYPAYGFENHVGYGTSAHIAALHSNGLIKFVHRVSFQPVAKLQETR